MTKRFLILLASASLTLSTRGAVRLPHLISDGMVIQQNSDARLWGWGDAGTTVNVTVSWSDATYSAVVDADGKWSVRVATPEASFTPLSITFDDGDAVTIHDVLSGEVWVCAGQSNMEMPVKGFGNCPVNNYNLEVINAVDGIRSVKIPSVMSTVPLEDADCSWRASSPETVSEFSATGYFFAKTVRQSLNIPIGLIEANKGGSRVESWLDEDNLRKYTDEPLDSVEMIDKFSWDFHRPLLWGNGTFHPILNYTVKGILFYQGCSNVGDPAGQYTERLRLLVEQWRRDFGEGDIPFYFVEIAPYRNDDGIDGESGARLREQQYNATKVIPNSAMVGTNDLVYPYEFSQIHPAQKQEVGQRLAFLALNKTYGKKEIVCDSPVYESMSVSNDTVFVQLNYNSLGINRFENLEGFEVAGEDKVFHKANAYHYWLQGIVITCPEVEHPVAVRYCFRNFSLGNVGNVGGLPLIPFRSDDW